MPFRIVADGAHEDRVAPEATKVPRDIERGPAEDAHPVGEVIEKDLSEDQGSSVDGSWTVSLDARPV